MLQKKLTLYGLTMIAVGSCIGSGIFATPGPDCQRRAERRTRAGSLGIGWRHSAYGCAHVQRTWRAVPKVGRVYVYLKEAYGELAGFLYGWVILLVINTRALAGHVPLCRLHEDFAPEMGEGTKTAIAAVTMLVLTGINILGVNVSQSLSNFFTGLKLLAIAAIIVAGFVFFDSAKVPVDFSLAENLPSTSQPPCSPA
ncbi:MAG: amino acid permease [Saprospiraceae bacterium]|nr:amino acid permease [Saprospiraceae bacterium]